MTDPDPAVRAPAAPSTAAQAPATPLFGFDAYQPAEIAARVDAVGVRKARMPLLPAALLGVLAGGFIGLGALYFTIVASDPALPWAAGRVLGGIAFSLGLVLVVVAGAELFTGNNLLAMAWADGRIGTVEMLRNWALTSTTNFVGAAGLAVLVFLSGHPSNAGGAIANAYLRIAIAKCELPLAEMFFRAVLCNVLVCLAVWMTLAGRSVTDKVVAVIFPISAFVAAGFEHSVANMYFLPLALLLKAAGASVAGIDALGIAAVARNLAVVMLGNIAGGSVMVALVYHFAYRRATTSDGGSGDQRTRA